jgi:hypothetical protein
VLTTEATVTYFVCRVSYNISYQFHWLDILSVPYIVLDLTLQNVTGFQSKNVSLIKPDFILPDFINILFKDVGNMG